MYKQHDGYDKFRVRDDDGHTKTSGKATYNEDGSLQRLDLIHPRGNGIHDHEVIKQLEDGDYWHRYFPDHPDHKKS